VSGFFVKTDTLKRFTEVTTFISIRLLYLSLFHPPLFWSLKKRRAV